MLISLFLYVNSSLYVWNISNGKIIKTLNLNKGDIVLECFSDTFICLASKSTANGQSDFDLELRKFSFKFDVRLNILKRNTCKINCTVQNMTLKC